MTPGSGDPDGPRAGGRPRRRGPDWLYRASPESTPRECFASASSEDRRSPGCSVVTAPRAATITPPTWTSSREGGDVLTAPQRTVCRAGWEVTASHGHREPVSALSRAGSAPAPRRPRLCTAEGGQMPYARVAKDHRGARNAPGPRLMGASRTSFHSPRPAVSGAWRHEKGFAVVLTPETHRRFQRGGLSPPGRDAIDGPFRTRRSGHISWLAR